MGEVIAENDLARHIRYRHRIERASWSSATNLWTVEAVRTDSGEPTTFTANFLWMCQGYYRHSEGYTPEWKDMDAFQGRIVHPQLWPEDIELKDKKVVVIGSGATAATLIPAIADECAHVTMLQRSPTFFRLGRNAIELAETLRQLQVKEEWIHEIVRRKILFEQDAFTRRCLAEPEQVKKELIGQITAVLGPDYDVETHFTPTIPAVAAAHRLRSRCRPVPWHQERQGLGRHRRDRPLHEARAFVLKSGNELDADIIVTATGFNLCVLGDIAFSIDGKPLDFADTVTYRGMMFTGVPNMAWVFGYFRASWTLRTDLVADFVCRLLAHMKKKGATEGHPGAAAGRPQHAAIALDRSGKFQSGLHDAQHASVAQARRQAGMAAQPGLLGRKGPVPGDRSRRCRVRLRLSAGNTRRSAAGGQLQRTRFKFAGIPSTVDCPRSILRSALCLLDNY